MNSYRILLADNHELFRHGIRNMVCQSKDIHIAAETDNGHELLKLIKEAHPDMIIMDVDLQNLNGLEVLKQVKQEHPRVKVLILTTNKHKQFIFKAMENGVDGFILKEDPGSEVNRAVETLRQDRKFFSNLLACDLINSIIQRPEEDLLSLREKEILQYLAEGTPNDEIAASLKISINTFYRHRQNIKRKLNFRNQTDLIRFAVSHKNAW
jgi:DNA-binding NarL/FixJ family response regulator